MGFRPLGEGQLCKRIKKYRFHAKCTAEYTHEFHEYQVKFGVGGWIRLLSGSGFVKLSIRPDRKGHLPIEH